jgi:DNA-directed RNA polymerase I, II, and III subunit RPABC2
MSDYEESEPESEVSDVEEEEVIVTKKPIVKKIDPVSGDEASEEGSDSDESSDNGVSDDDDNISVSDDDGIMEGDDEAIFSQPIAKPTRKGKAHVNKNVSDDEDSLHLGELELSDDEDEDEEDLDGSRYVHQFDDQTKEQVVANYHPELMVHNYDEVEALSRVTRDAKGIIVDPLHRTLPFLTKYERTRILGERAKQINGGAKPFISVNPSVIDGYLIAMSELEQKKIPFIIRRPLNNGGSEYWKIQDLDII